MSHGRCDVFRTVSIPAVIRILVYVIVLGIQLSCIKDRNMLCYQLVSMAFFEIGETNDNM